MDGMEIIVSKDALNGLTNYDELMAFAKEQIAPYESMVVTEDQLSTAKDVVAKMRKVSKAASDLRIRTEREHAAKIALTVQQLKEISGTFTDAAARIDTQVKAIVNERKQAKRGELIEYFKANVGIAGNYITFEDVEDEKWLNASVTMETATAQMDEALVRFREDAEALQSLDAEPSIKAAVEKEYRRTKSMSTALKYMIELERMAAEEKARKEKEAALKAAQEAAAVSAPVNLTQTETIKPEPKEEPKPEAETQRIVFWVEAPREKFKLLREFLVSNGMKYGKA